MDFSVHDRITSICKYDFFSHLKKIGINPIFRSITSTFIDRSDVKIRVSLSNKGLAEKRRSVSEYAAVIGDLLQDFLEQEFSYQRKVTVEVCATTKAAPLVNQKKAVDQVPDQEHYKVK